MTPPDTTSYWSDTSSFPRLSTLKKDVEVDVIVVGGGITGLTAAYLFKKAGKTVALLERDGLATVDTGHTTAHLTAVTDSRLYELAETFGETAARAVWDAGATAIDQIVTLIRTKEIDCDFRWVPGYLHQEKSAQDPKKAREELEREIAMAKRLGIEAEWREEVPVYRTAGIRFPHQALFHPLKYLSALASLIPGNGSYVFTSTEAGDVQDDPLELKAGNFTIKGSYLVMATHTPLTGKAGVMRAMMFQTKLALYTSYALGARLRTGSAPEAAWWDTADPYHYLRIERRAGYDYAIFGGEDHKTGQEANTLEAYQRLEEKFLRLFPDAAVDHRWSGQVIETNDGLPFIGETAKRQFAATGFAGNGMTFGTLSAMMAVDAYLRKKNPWQELFAADRAKIRGGAWDYLKENKDYPFYLLRDWTAPAAGDSLEALGRNEGKILKIGGKKVAAHRDADGKISLCSPVCTHLKCIVGWNDAEQTWDCPCHGSRFRPTGEVISGPAEEALEKLPAP